MRHQHAQVEVEGRAAPVLQREVAEAHHTDAVQELAELARDDRAPVLRAATCHLISAWIALNCGDSAVRTHSRHTISTVVGTAPEPIIFSQPTLAVVAGAGGDGVVRHVDLVAAVEQIVHGLIDAGMRLDAAHDDLRAAERRAAGRRSAGCPQQLIDSFSMTGVAGGKAVGDFGLGVAEPLRVLLGRQHRHRHAAWPRRPACARARTMRSCSTVWPR